MMRDDSDIIKKVQSMSRKLKVVPFKSTTPEMKPKEMLRQLKLIGSYSKRPKK